MSVFALHLKELAGLVGAIAAQGIVDSAADATHFVDAQRIEADDAWNNHGFYIYQGTAQGREGTVTDFVASTDTFTLAPTGTQLDNTSRYILLHHGWTMDMLRQAFILAMRQRKKYLFKPKVDESLTIAADTYEYTVPTGYVAIQRIIREDSVGAGNFFTILGHELWYINKDTTKQIVFSKPQNDRLGFLDADCKLRLIGQAYETEPDDDTDTISVPTGSLLFLAAAIAHGMMAPHDTQNAEKRAALMADARRNFYQSRNEDASKIWADSQMVEDL